jgi:single-strand DNA-binding protein
LGTLNRVTILGNLGADPEVRQTPNGKTIVHLRIATTTRRQHAESGGTIEETIWHRVVQFGRDAEIAKEHLTKGDTCLIEGRLQTRKWTDKQGVERYTTEIVCERLVLIGSRKALDQSNTNTQEESHASPSNASTSWREVMKRGPTKEKASHPSVGNPFLPKPTKEEATTDDDW